MAERVSVNEELVDYEATGLVSSPRTQRETSQGGVTPSQGQLRLEDVLQLIPTCRRCQIQRKKCDTQLPSCKNCHRFGLDCVFYDHALGQDLPRNYVESLVERYKQLKRDTEAEPTQNDAIVSSPNGDLLGPRVQSDAQSDDLAILNPIRLTEGVAHEQATKYQSYDYHYLVPQGTQEVPRFFGASSVYTLTVEVLARAFNEFETLPTVDFLFVGAGSVPPLEKPANPSMGDNRLFQRDKMFDVADFYMVSFNSVYPIIEESTWESELDAFLQSQHDHGTGGSTTQDVHRSFRILMMCAIGCMLKSRYDSSLIGDSNVYYTKALRHLEVVTSEASASSLQAIFLLIRFCLLKPAYGGIWKLLDYACRLCIELGYHTERSSPTEDERQRALRRNSFWSLYAIERIIGQIFGRPSDLPEEIITTEYPERLDGGIPLDTASIHVYSSVHTYRIVYLRSEIYKELYLPTSFPEYGLEWYYKQLNPVLEWYHEVEGLDDPRGNGIVTSKVGYFSTIIFIFQPLLLQALSGTRQHILDDSLLKVIPSDGYFAACQLIDLYEKVLAAPVNSQLGVYPTTIMSAHYIYLSTLAIMGHCLLQLDGRIMTLAPFSEGSAIPDIQQINFERIFSISNTCVSLLTWCADRWPGMGGMLAVYKRVSERVLPEMIRNRII